MSRAYQSSRLKIPAKPFISTWNTATTYTGSTANNQIRLPLISTGTYKFTVNWGDSTSDNITTWNQAEVTHTYAAPGTYTVTITGFIKGWDFAGFVATPAAVVSDRRKLTSITQFGCLEFVTYSTSTLTAGAFYQCTNLTLNGLQDYPNFKNCTQVTGFLRECTGLATIPGVNKWDVSKITFFRNFFREAINFNDNIGNWNTSKGEDFSVMFRGSSSVLPYGLFNNGGSDSIKNWDMSNAKQISTIFFNQRFFNQEIGKWNITNKCTDISYFVGCFSAPGSFTNAGSDSIKNWDVSNVTTMESAFQYQKFFDVDLSSWNTANVTRMNFMFWGNYIDPGSFNNAGNPGIGSWNTSKVTTMASMFHGNNKFNQNIGAWDVSKVLDMTYMLGSSTPVPSPMIFNNGGSPSINNWNTGLVTNMGNMFRNNPGFNQQIGNWNVSNVTSFTNFMQPQTSANYTPANYDNLLIGWSSRPVKPNISINMGSLKYTAAAVAARAILTSAPNNWTIADGGLL